MKTSTINFSEKELNKLINKFNRDCRAIEFPGVTTYCINYKDPKGDFRIRLKSSDRDELLEMYKCAWKGRTIPERTATLLILKSF